ncbi:cupredoxin domain-containing protein [Hymenobacter sp. UV11]|jgi:plastocyanin domain-containing protein|uniref:cupredoxin domain-containing protein n=1 Tax=Hymenobacter sp. UV11 TaxID=1849735 RepID=UPI0010605C7E|nr:cupredoxin domain-containing protein [Hymenobacter sp. UV11]TDN36952.1 copper-transporting ATPase [Hymenobacter sp. UV11]TFZ64289.1 cupredoxin domain-containing protein [Hymenobacter sp. UV11]
MDTTQIIVTVVGVGLLAFVGWFFFLAPHRVAAAVSSSAGVQQVDIVVKGGYSPNVIEVEHGKPVQLNFYRDEENSCSEELLLPDFNIRRDLAPFKTTAIEFLPQQAGTFEFTCGMHMLRGSLVVK